MNEIETPHFFEDHIFLSPHLDDAIFSADPLIASLISNGASTRIATFFAGSPQPHMKLSGLTQQLHHR